MSPIPCWASDGLWAQSGRGVSQSDHWARLLVGWIGPARSPPLCVKWHRQPAHNAGLEGRAAPGSGRLMFDGLVLRPMAHHLRSDTALRGKLAGFLVFHDML